MLIGIDIDEVLSETIDFVLEYHKGEIKGKKIERNQISDYLLANIPGYEFLTVEESAGFFIEALRSERAFASLKPVDWAYKKLKQRKESGHHFYAITARGEPLRESTQQRIDKHFPDIFDKVIFCNHYRPDFPKYTKEDICVENGIALFVEDNPKYAIDLEKLGIKVFLLDKPWNASFNEQEHPWITKVKSRENIELKW